jgi:hypothetical protein
MPANIDVTSPFWRVLVEYSADVDSSTMERAITHAAKRPIEFSGGGMGRRDCGWHCATEFDAGVLRVDYARRVLTLLFVKLTRQNLHEPAHHSS